MSPIISYGLVLLSSAVGHVLGMPSVPMAHMDVGQGYQAGGIQSPITSEQSPMRTMAEDTRAHLLSNVRSYSHMCDSPEGSVRYVNNRAYRIYCYNSKYLGYAGLGFVDTFEECEQNYHKYNVATYGFHWVPSTNACYAFTIEQYKMYAYEEGNYEKIFAIPTSFPKELPVCPLEDGEGAIHYINDKPYRLFCKGQAHVSATNLKQLGKATSNITECEAFFREQGGEMFHWYQPYELLVGDGTGFRYCEVVTTWTDPRELVPTRLKNTYLAAVPHYPHEDIEL